jgi:predicted ATPase
MVEQLKTTLTILMAQSRRLINEMKLMARRNSFYKNNILMATFILDKCRREQPPETDEEFDAMFD